VLDEMQKTNMAESAEAAESLLKLLANRFRLQILCALVEGEKSAGEIESMLDISQSAVSQHLARLRDKQVVATERRGQMVFYRLASIEVNAILSTLYLIYCNK
jgi:DNA-binding transcriptional ArsR family regulator